MGKRVGHPVQLPDGPVERVISLVPSLTEAICSVGLSTTRFLLAAGHVVIAWLLRRQAEVAQAALNAGATVADKPSTSASWLPRDSLRGTSCRGSTSTAGSSPTSTTRSWSCPSRPSEQRQRSDGQPPFRRS